MSHFSFSRPSFFSLKLAENAASGNCFPSFCTTFGKTEEKYLEQFAGDFLILRLKDDFPVPFGERSEQNEDVIKDSSSMIL